MLTDEEITKRVNVNEVKVYHEQLYQWYTNPLKSKLTGFFSKNKKDTLSKKVAELGLMLLNCFPDCRDNYKRTLWTSERGYYEEPYWGYQDEVKYGGKRLLSFKELYSQDNIWDGENFSLLIFFFGEERATYIKKVWEIIPQYMYQSGWARRSFRRPNDSDMAYCLRLNMMIKLINHDSKHNFSLIETIDYDNKINNYNSNTEFIWAAAIDAGNEKIYSHLCDILLGEAEIGKVSRRIIKALLISNKVEAWQKVEQLLLSAQRQEGLRQTILEALDETSLGALKYIINVVLEHNLSRFSSVVRSIDTWAGFGWDGEKQSTVKRFLTLGQKYLEDPTLISKAVTDKDNGEVYIALWAQGAHDIDKCHPYLEELFTDGNIEKKTLALYFIAQANLNEWNESFGSIAINDDNLQIVYWAIQLLNRVEHLNKIPDIFNRLENLFQLIPKKESVFTGKVFSWLTFKLNRSQVGSLMIKTINFQEQNEIEKLLPYFNEMEVSNREQIARSLIGKFHGSGNNKINARPNIFQRNFALEVIKDRSEYVKNAAISALKLVELSEDEVIVFEGLLSRKSANLRKSVIEIINKRPVDKVFESAERLIESKSIEQRLAGLDILNEFFKEEKEVARVRQLANKYKERQKIGSKEQILIDNLLEEKAIQYNLENGYGLYDIGNTSNYAEPKTPTDGPFVRSLNRKHPYGLSMSITAIKDQLEKLKEIFLSNAEYEYEVQNYNSTSKRKVLLGNEFLEITRNESDFSDRQKFENIPLFEKWEAWFSSSGLNTFDLFLINFSDFSKSKKEVHLLFPKTANKLKNSLFFIELPKIKGANYEWQHPIATILKKLTLIHPYQNKADFFINAMQYVLANINKSELGVVKVEKTRWSTYYKDVFDINVISKYLIALKQSDGDDNQFKKFWDIIFFIYKKGTTEEIEKHQPLLKHYTRAHSLGLCTKDELMARILKPDSITTLTSEKGNRRDQKEAIKLKEDFPFLIPMIKICKERILEVELKRGDSGTPVTLLAQRLQIIYGVDYFIKLLNGLGKDTLNRGYIYSWSNSAYNKKQVLSTLLKRCYPASTDHQEQFNASVKEAKISERRLVEVAVYAQQWLGFINGYLNWKGMESAVWWLHAHTNSYHNAETETEVAKFSTVDMSTFKDGAVDTNWFLNAYKDVGKQRWKLLYDAAKYVSDGSGHSRAKLYADVITGNIKIREVTKKVKDKRNQDYLRVFGLVPLSKVNKEKDLLSRYNYLLKFKKESRQFGSQRQASESLAVRIAMENLARTANYPDPIRLTWAMETEEAKQIMSKADKLIFGEVSIQLKVDEFGKSKIETIKSGKKLNNIPAKLRKDPEVVELKTFHKKLKDQYSRSRKSLEDAMVRGDEFKANEIKTLATHPVIAPMLSNLVLIGEEGLGFLKAEVLVDVNGNETKISDKTRIAHCTDLHKNGQWSDFQRYCFDNDIVQPFKQVFRELYLPTVDELQEESISRRYAGHQVQPKKTVAVLKSRGWTVDYEEGLQKVFHKEGFIAKIYAMADWFSPADVERPTLETVEFLDRNTYKRIAFKEINPQVFSEVMRDIDLVVSVAHVGGVDPEASHSTVEMRAAIIRETTRLFKLNNVEIEGHHARIKGSLSNYSVHLGSAVCHLSPGGYLSILPVHSQHRGRLFLPFIDEDPKSAEVMSKILLLAKDDEIKDPTILSQIQR